MAQPYKHPKSGIFQLRRKVPDDLRQALARREYKRSLDTRDPTEAKARFVLAWANGALWPGSPAQGRTRMVRHEVPYRDVQLEMTLS